MHQIIYTSTARAGLSQEDVFRIVEQSARNNPSHDITGFLLFRKGKFLQLVEGPLMALETLLAQLGNDDRHSDLTVVCFPQALPTRRPSQDGHRKCIFAN
jgi:hypothetical protein